MNVKGKTGARCGAVLVVAEGRWQIARNRAERTHGSPRGWLGRGDRSSFSGSSREPHAASRLFSDMKRPRSSRTARAWLANHWYCCDSPYAKTQGPTLPPSRITVSTRRILCLHQQISTPLSRAAAKGHLGVVKLLLERGAAVNVPGRGGLTPLHEAAGCGQVREDDHRNLQILYIRRGCCSGGAASIFCCVGSQLWHGGCLCACCVAFPAGI